MALAVASRRFTSVLRPQAAAVFVASKYVRPFSTTGKPDSRHMSTTAAGETSQMKDELPKGEIPFISIKDEKAKKIASAEPDVTHFRTHGGHHPLEKQAKILPYHSWLPHPVWGEEATSTVKITHVKPEVFADRAAYFCVQSLRALWDVTTGYGKPGFKEAGWIDRMTFLETVAGVPGMVGAMCRHLQSLRRMERDYGWIHTLLEEAENERMHLMTALVLKQPNAFFRGSVLVAQGVFLTFFSISYLISPKFCHRFVGYLEEEAVKTYTKMLEEMNAGKLPGFDIPAPPVARHYWQLEENATLKDVILAVRADEAHHREVNHTFASMRRNDPNPFPPGY